MTPDQIKAARALLGLSQQQFAEAIGYSTFRRISEVENGKRPLPRAKVLMLRRLLLDIGATHDP